MPTSTPPKGKEIRSEPDPNYSLPTPDAINFDVGISPINYERTCKIEILPPHPYVEYSMLGGVDGGRDVSES